MGRPRVVRSPEEQAAFDERRRAFARERARRRRADPAVRAALAQAIRQRRQTEPEFRERNVEAVRRRRAADPELREREAAAKRQRRVADPEFRERDIQAKRQRRANDPEYRARELERLQRRRLGLPQGAGICADNGGDGQPFPYRKMGDRKKEPASSCTHGKSAKPVQTEASWLFNSSVDVAVETPRSIHVCKSTQASLVAVKVHRWTETTDLVERKDSATYVQEFPAPHVRGMPGLTNMDQSPGVATLYSHQVDAQCDGTFVDRSTSPAAVRIPYHRRCIVRWCTNTLKTYRGRLFRIPKDHRMEAFLRYIERPQLIGLPKEIVNNYRLCSAHFTESDYVNTAKNKLIWSAVPSVKAPDKSKGLTRKTA
ncbi:uncharacterized protein LOC119457893 isoform X2 [Dermacentor silvarum]|uniref:uncharacterized protein LOC119457893 isoform X2 n=1 Tax=Dermacentor silvarum TaxID=543639 RepID=UPI002101384D|nr:uncharacterized protein LOC119457893 isoform X2 [Dermacentor silvarum]